jgi:flagellar basal-body rod modification protein FlgD
MSFISPISTTTSSSSSSSSSTSTGGLGKDDFLQLMVTKLQYQDPLNPASDTDYIAQLAQFSSLEQLSNISDELTSSNQWSYLQSQSLNNVLASNLVGREVKADFSGVYLDDSGEANFSYTTKQAATEVKFEVLNSSGTHVATISADDVAAGSHSITWDGKDDRGNSVAAGYYTVKATATNTDGTTFTPDMSVSGIVTNVVYNDGSAYVVIDGLQIALGDIKSIGQAPQE